MTDYISLQQAAEIARQTLNDQGITQEAAAKDLEVNQSAVSRALRGRSEYKRLIARIINAYSAHEIDVEEPRYPLRRNAKET
jgi:transcriptional regulator with XRE-family HTH domain